MAERLHHDIHHLRRMLLEMGALVDAQLRRATQALLACDRGMAQHAINLSQQFRHHAQAFFCRPAIL